MATTVVLPTDNPVRLHRPVPLKSITLQVWPDDAVTATTPVGGVLVPFDTETAQATL